MLKRLGPLPLLLALVFVLAAGTAVTNLLIDATAPTGSATNDRASCGSVLVHQPSVPSGCEDSLEKNRSTVVAGALWAAGAVVLWPFSIRWTRRRRQLTVLATLQDLHASGALDDEAYEKERRRSMTSAEEPPVKRSGVRKAGRLAAKGVAWYVALVAALFVAGIVVGVVKAVSSKDDGAAVEDVFGSGAELSDSDSDKLAQMAQYPKEWNRAATPLIADYLDPDVQADVWLSRAPRQMEALTLTARRFQAAVLRISDVKVRAPFQKMADNYGEKLVALQALIEAVAYGDRAAEAAAASQVDAAAQKGKIIAVEFLAALRPYMDADQVAQLDTLGLGS